VQLKFETARWPCCQPANNVKALIDKDINHQSLVTNGLAPVFQMTKYFVIRHWIPQLRHYVTVPHKVWGGRDTALSWLNEVAID